MTHRAHRVPGPPRQAEIPRSRFALGQAEYPSDPEALRLGRFSDGQQALDRLELHPHRGRFSEGQERLGDEDPEKHIRRRFSEGQDHLGDEDRGDHVLSDGTEIPRTSDHRSAPAG